MTFIKKIALIGATTIALSSNEALAEPCNGHVISKPLPSILLKEAPDGSKATWVSSEGLFIVASPQDHPANWVNRVCGGGFKIAPDGKSGEGMGTCVYADMDGDVFHLAWESTFVEGTWKITGGTGKFENISGSGTFKPKKRYDNSWGGSTWEGECNLGE